MTTEAAPAVRLLKFSSKQCPACANMARSKVIERFLSAHPEVSFVALDCVDDEGETPEGSDYEKNMKLSDVYGVDSFPTLVFEAPGGGELSSWEGGIPASELEKTYKAAKARLEASLSIPSPKKAAAP